MRRVAVTTTPDTAPRLVDALVDRRLQPVELPCIRIEVSDTDVLDRLRSAAVHADLVVLTSRRTIRILWPEGRMPAVPVVAVGPSTAAAAGEAGGRVVHVGSGGTTEMMPTLERLSRGTDVVFPHARAADPATADLLARSARSLVSAAAYDTVPIGPDTEPPIDAALFGSPSAVAGWTRTRSLDGIVIAAMGRTTAGALERLGHPAAVVPPTPGFDELVWALSDHLHRDRSHT